MTTSQRAAEGLISSVLRRQSRGLHPRVEPRPRRAPATRPTAALLVMDVEREVPDRRPGEVVDRAAEAVVAARQVGMMVVFVRAAPRAGDDSAGHPDLAPLLGEPIVTTRRVSAFSGTDLEVLMRVRRARSLVLCGIATSGVVLSTLRAAADLDFELTVLRDACADADPEVHRILLDKVFPQQAEVIDVATWATGLTGHVVVFPGRISS